MDTTPGLYVVISGEKCFLKELSELYECFRLLTEKNSSKRMKDYLASPYFVKEHLLTDLFSRLYDAFTDGRRKLQGGALFDSLFKSPEPVAGHRKLKRLLKLLRKELLNFHSMEFLQNNPAEQARMQAKALRFSGQKKLHHDALKEWKVVAEKQARGIDRTSLLWEASLASHFSLDVSKEHSNAESLSKLSVATSNLVELSGLILETEKVSRKHFFKDASLPEVEPSKSLLPGLYNSLAALYAAPDFSDVLYERLRLNIIDAANEISDTQLYALVGLSLNYLIHHHRKGSEVRNRILFWSEWQLSKNVYPSFQGLSKTWFLNQVHNAVDCDRDDLAEKVIDRYGGRIFLHQRHVAQLHASVIRSFGQDEHDEVFEQVTSAVQNLQLDPHTDGLRLKSFRLRCALCAYANSLEGIATQYEEEVEDAKHQQYKTAMKDFENYLYKRTKDIEKGRLLLLRRFLNIVRRFYDAFSTEINLDADYEPITKLIETPESLHGREWFRCLLWHFEPRREENRLPLQPSLNQARMRSVSLGKHPQ